MKNKLGGIGASEVAKLFTSQGLESKGVKTLCVEKCEELINGKKRLVSSIAMSHGLFNEEEAFHFVVKSIYPKSRYRSSESVWINENCWATPDVTDKGNDLVIDIKCPYTVPSFFKNKNNLPKSYLYQIQMQMLATGFNNGLICLYLTSNKIDTYGNKIEYNIDIDDRYELIPILKDEEIQVEIPLRVEKFISLRDMLMSDLGDAVEVSDTEFFFLHNEKKITRLQDKANPFNWGGQIIRNNDRHYVLESK